MQNDEAGERRIVELRWQPHITLLSRRKQCTMNVMSAIDATLSGHSAKFDNHRQHGRVLDCGGKQRATPLSSARGAIEHSKAFRPHKSGVASRPAGLATALQDASRISGATANAPTSWTAAVLLPLSLARKLTECSQALPPAQKRCRTFAPLREVPD
jgi:hypothetical protein